MLSKSGWLSIGSMYLVLGIGLTNLMAQSDGVSRRSERTSGTHVFPASTVAYLEIAEPAELIDRILEHPLRDTLQQLPAVEEALAGLNSTEAKLAIALIESRSGAKWPDLLKSLTRRGIYLGIDESEGGGVLLARAESASKLKETLGILLGMIKQDAESKGNPVPYRIQEYRGHKVAKLDGGTLARIDDWLLLSNKPALAKTVADNLIDHSQTALPLPFEKQLSRLGSSNLVGYLDMEALRQRDIAPQLLGGQADNAGIELLFGGVLEAMNQSSELLLGVNLRDDSFELRAELPFDFANQLSPSRHYFFGTEQLLAAPIDLPLDDLLANVTAYRDLAGWWNSKEDLFEENVIAQLSQTDSQLSTLFGGLDFGNEVLGGLQPGVQLVAKRQDYPDNYEPDTRLPAFAVIGRLENPEMSRRLRISYQSMIGIVNMQLAADGQPQLETNNEQLTAGRMDWAAYLTDTESSPGLLLYNFSPTLAFQDEFIIISSTHELAKEIIDAASSSSLARNSQPAASEPVVNTRVELDGPQLHQLLEENREALIVQNMLESGSQRKQAAANIDNLLSLARLSRQLRLTLAGESDRLTLDVQLDFQP